MTSERTPSYIDFAAVLAANGFSGDILTSQGSRLMYATDNSIYQQNPQLVAQPRNTADLVILQELLAHEDWRGLSLTPFGGGTGTNGQALNNGLVVDCKRHMNHIEQIEVQQGWVRVEPGVTLGQLNAVLRPLGVFFAPEVSPADRATIGGMVATDASGKGSRVYGKTSGHLLDARVVLPGGEVIDCADEKAQGKAASLRALLTETADAHADEIARRFPALTREATGYNLRRVAEEPRRALQYLFAGSEGTLGVFASLTLKLTPLPKHNAMLVVGYSDFSRALTSVRTLAPLPILAIETFDETLFSLARKDSAWLVVGHVFADAPLAGESGGIRCCNLLELVGDTPEELDQRIEQVSAQLAGEDEWFARIDAEKDINAMWNLRSRGVGILGNMPGSRQPQAFIEDCAVEPEKLPDFVRELKELLAPHQLAYALYGHVDVGCLHLRPALDLTRDHDRRLWRSLTQQVLLLCKQYGGVFWGEHGKGWRSGLAREYFGETLYQAMCRIKALCDPFNQMNPGKLATPGGEPPVAFDVPALRADHNRRIGKEAATAFGDSLRCNGNTACLGYAPTSVMCPSYKATRDLRNSPKGRATLVREWLRRRESGELKNAFTDEVHKAMDACLGCKACAGNCPVQVSIPELKSRFLAAIGGTTSMRDKLLAASEWIANSGSLFPSLANFVVTNPVSRFFTNTLGVYDSPSWQRKRRLKYVPRAGLRALKADKHPHKVVLLQDAFLNAYDPAPLAATAELLTRAGARVYVSRPINSGKSAYALGSRFAALRRMRHNSRLLQALAGRAALVGVEPSVVLFMQQEYADNGLRVPIHFAHQWLAERLEEGILKLPKIGGGATVSLFTHCTEQTTCPQSRDAWRKLFGMLGAQCFMPQVGCCGMAGWYGHLSQYAGTSQSLFESGWKRQLEHAKGLVLATGFSCRQQCRRNTRHQPEHPLVALNRLVKKIR